MLGVWQWFSYLKHSEALRFHNLLTVPSPQPYASTVYYNVYLQHLCTFHWRGCQILPRHPRRFFPERMTSWLLQVALLLPYLYLALLPPSVIFLEAIFVMSISFLDSTLPSYHLQSYRSYSLSCQSHSRISPYPISHIRTCYSFEFEADKFIKDQCVFKVFASMARNVRIKA